MLLELAVFNGESCRVAAECGVQRIELCENYTEGGLTPPAELFSFAKSVYGGDIFVMLRPRPGDFVYSHFEEEVILAEAVRFAALGAAGFVAGFLTSAGEINFRQTARLVRACAPLPVTFHRAFDRAAQWKESVDALIEAGCRRVLTSGGLTSAMDGRYQLAEMKEYAAGRIIVMPGGGIRSDNLPEIMTACRPQEVHTAAISALSAAKQDYSADQEEVKRLMAIISDSAMDV